LTALQRTTATDVEDDDDDDDDGCHGNDDGSHGNEDDEAGNHDSNGVTNSVKEPTTENHLQRQSSGGRHDIFAL